MNQVVACILKEECIEMIKEADTDDDGKVSFVEFKAILHESKPQQQHQQQQHQQPK